MPLTSPYGLDQSLGSPILQGKLRNRVKMMLSCHLVLNLHSTAEPEQRKANRLFHPSVLQSTVRCQDRTIINMHKNVLISVTLAPGVSSVGKSLPLLGNLKMKEESICVLNLNTVSLDIEKAHADVNQSRRMI